MIDCGWRSAQTKVGKAPAIVVGFNSGEAEARIDQSNQRKLTGQYISELIDYAADAVFAIHGGEHHDQR